MYADSDLHRSSSRLLDGLVGAVCRCCLCRWQLVRVVAPGVVALTALGRLV